MRELKEIKKLTPLERRRRERQQPIPLITAGLDRAPDVVVNRLPHNEKVKHPGHYNWHPTGVEAIVIARAMTFNVGSAMTYLWRNEHKGTQLKDLKKAVFHIVDEIDRLEQAMGIKPQERYVFAKHGGKLP